MGFDKNQFLSFIGLNYGDTVDKALGLFGVPDDDYIREEHHYSVYYYMSDDEDVMSVGFNKADNVIESIYLGCNNMSLVMDWIDLYAAGDDKTSFINMHIDSIIENMGSPDTIELDDYIYKNEKMEVIFHCPESNDFYCQRIFLNWFY